jgi:hypothetical protein
MRHCTQAFWRTRAPLRVFADGDTHMSMIAIAWYLGVGAAAGLLAGLLGVGGGLIIVAALVWILPHQGVPASAVTHVALATSLASMLATSLASTRAHVRRGAVMWSTVAYLAPGMMLGSALGAIVADSLSGTVLRYGVALFCFAAGAQLWLGGAREHADSAPVPRGLGLSGAGVIVGAISALVGIGGGSMTVPLLVAYGARAVRAVGTSAACGFAIALAGATSYALGGRDVQASLPPGSWGYVYWPAALAIACASVVLAPAGAALAHRLSGRALKRVFGGFLWLMGLAVLRAAA